VTFGGERVSSGALDVIIVVNADANAKKRGKSSPVRVRGRDSTCLLGLLVEKRVSVDSSVLI
jgi:hypothetical protein